MHRHMKARHTPRSTKSQDDDSRTDRMALPRLSLEPTPRASARAACASLEGLKCMSRAWLG